MKLPEDLLFSQSNLQDYVNCHYKFYLRHIQKFSWPALLTDDALEVEQHMQSGARFHTLVHQFFLGLPLESLDQIALSDPNEQLQTWWHNFKQTVPDQIKGETFPELSLVSKLNGHRLIVKYDLVIVEKDQLTIYDWKTTQRLPKPASLNTRIQSRIYPFVLAREASAINNGSLQPGQIKMVYWQAQFPGQTHTIAYNQDMFEADLAYLSHLVDEIVQLPIEGFTKTPHLTFCKYCNFRSFCDKGISAGLLSELDRDLDDLELSAFNIDLDQVEEISF